MDRAIGSVINMEYTFFTKKVFLVIRPHGMCKLGFPSEWDSATFRYKGTEAPLLSRAKGTTGQAQNLAKGRDGPGQLKSGTGRAGTAKIWDGTRDKMGQRRKGCSKTGN